MLLNEKPISISVNRFLIFLSVFNIIGIISVSYFYGINTGLKGSYALISIFLAYILFQGTTISQGSTSESIKYSKLAMSIILLSVTGIAITDFNLAISAFVFGLVSVLIILNLSHSGFSHNIWIILLALSSILGPIGKIYSSRLYYGSTDIFPHLGIVREITKSQSLFTISGNYKFFPGYHLTVTTIELLTGLNTYDALVFLGVITFVTGIFGIIFLTNILYHNNYKLSLAAALGYCSLPVVFSYHSYFTTHPFGTTLSIYFIICILKRKSYRFMLIFLLVVGAVTISHHLSLGIVVVFLFLAAAIELGSYRVTNFPQRAWTAQKRAFYLLLVGTIPLTYWSFFGESFITRFLISSKNALYLLIYGTGETSATIITLGNVQPKIPSQNIADFIFNTSTINITIMLGLFLIGFLIMLSEKYNHRVIAILPISIISVMFLLKLPIQIPQQPRFQMVGSIFVSIVIGVGIYSTTRIQSDTRTIAKIILIFLLCTTALIQGSYGTHYLLTDSNNSGGSFSTSEYEHITQSREFSYHYNKDVESLYIEYRYISSFNQPIGWAGANNEGIEVDSKLLLVRESWSNQLLFSSGAGLGVKNQLYMSEYWLRSAINNKNVIYTSGDNKYVYMDKPQNFNNEIDRSM
ncbi:hypothetical protein [Halorubrum sp. GN11GM_10-3_MGM]|uniref:hypothetical protein n=1 Tax=Halorubrum sp. GN11GM_10-3_MGM TaxID=2518111 RepID=UPI00113C1E9E|nr:hypothetical protein [Halorubrum sp. GN11GM_10-3_MGM]TKX69190.1 hypothetical protein EXE40_11150 [Halorubrum sp. GN11GM_10-3_MGM]